MKMSVVTIVLIGLVAGAALSPSLRTDQVRLVYGPPKVAKHQPIHDELRERGTLETLRTLLSPLRLPRKLTLEVRGCDGKVEAFYDDDTVTLCYEYIELIQRHAPKVSTSEGIPRADAIVGSIIDTLLHEVGHAVFDMLEIPVFGREEDAADYFSVYILAQFPPDDARRLIQGAGFVMASEARASLESPLTRSTLASEHGLLAQRYYNLLCMAYGSNPKTFSDAISSGGLPKKRADGCAEEFAMLQRAFRKLILPHIDEAMQRQVFGKIRFNWSPSTPSTAVLDPPPLGEPEIFVK
jgi:hypothetical protein